MRTSTGGRPSSPVSPLARCPGPRRFERWRSSTISGGAVGYVNVDGNLDFCIAIRTAVERGGVVHIQAGAGIVYDSVAETELEECRNKASALAKAVAMAEELR